MSGRHRSLRLTAIGRVLELPKGSAVPVSLVAGVAYANAGFTSALLWR